MERQKYRRDSSGVATFLLAALTPVAIWGLLSAILMQLIEIRLRYIEGGESKLMIATLAFAAGIILCQRLLYYQGAFSFIIYAVGLGISITWFSLYHAMAFQVPTIHPFFVFLINEGIYALLWYGTHHLVKACAMDPDESTIGQGVFASHWGKALPQAVVYEQPEEEKQWTVHMPRKHPGRLICLIALGSLPLFALTNYLTEPDDRPIQERLAFEMTLYIVSTIALLCLLALGQFRQYLEKRKASLPEVVGLAWLATGGIVLSLIICGAFILPQPPSTAAFVVQDYLKAMRVPLFKRLNDGGEREQDPKMQQSRSGTNSNDGAQKYGEQPAWSRVEIASPDGADAAVPDPGEQNLPSKSKGRIFSILLFGILISLFTFFALSMVFVFLACILFLLGGIAERLGKAGRIFWQWTLQIVFRVRWESSDPEAKPKKDFAAVVPFSDAFRDAGSMALVRYAWESLLQYCAQQGDPCDASMTPREFLNTHPMALQGFSEQAKALADLYTFSEFSDRPLPESAEGELRGYWNAFLAFSRNAEARGKEMAGAEKTG